MWEKTQKSLISQISRHISAKVKSFPCFCVKVSLGSFSYPHAWIRPPEESGEGCSEEAEARCRRAAGTLPTAGLLGEQLNLENWEKDKNTSRESCFSSWGSPNKKHAGPI